MNKLLNIQDQDQLVKRLIVGSVLAHVLVFVIHSINIAWSPPEFADEWAIEASLVIDSDLGAPDQTTLPQAKVDEQAAAAKQMLPQLTKKFSVEESQPQEDGDLPTEEPAPDDKKVSESKQKDLPKVMDQPDANKIKAQDALKRLALEKLRKQNEADQTQAEKIDPIARIKEELAANQKPNSSESTGLSTAEQRYRGQVQQAVRRHYSLPEAYNLKDANLVVIITVVINERGEIIKLDIYRSSGDNVFDDLAYQAVKSAAPLPPPPATQVGQQIHLQFTPKSF